MRSLLFVLLVALVATLASASDSNCWFCSGQCCSDGSCCASSTPICCPPAPGSSQGGCCPAGSSCGPNFTCISAFQQTPHNTTVPLKEGLPSCPGSSSCQNNVCYYCPDDTISIYNSECKCGGGYACYQCAPVNE